MDLGLKYHRGPVAFSRQTLSPPIRSILGGSHPQQGELFNSTYELGLTDLKEVYAPLMENTKA